MTTGLDKALELDVWAMQKYDTKLIDGAYVDLAKQRFYEKFTVEAKGHHAWYYRLLDSLGHRLLAEESGNDVLREAGMRVECGTCGLHVPYTFDFDTNTFTLESPCPFPDDHVPLSFDLAVPSGILVVENDMRRLMPEHPDDDTLDYFNDITKNFYVNTQWGCANTSLFYAKQGMAHCFVGNTCPGIYRLSEDHYQIGQFHKYEGDDLEPTSYEPGERVGGIITDLWWYSIMDKILYENSGGKADDWTDMVTVKPGIWTFTHHWHEGDFDRDDAMVYTDITFKG
jgi:hypothetical protein